MDIELWLFLHIITVLYGHKSFFQKIKLKKIDGEK